MRWWCISLWYNSDGPIVSIVRRQEDPMKGLYAYIKLHVFTPQNPTILKYAISEHLQTWWELGTEIISNRSNVYTIFGYNVNNYTGSSSNNTPFTQLQAMEEKQVQAGFDFDHLCILMHLYCTFTWYLNVLPFYLRTAIHYTFQMPERLTSNTIQYTHDYLTRIFWLTSTPISSMIINVRCK